MKGPSIAAAGIHQAAAHDDNFVGANFVTVGPWWRAVDEHPNAPPPEKFHASSKGPARIASPPAD
jgi:hypothetical protein